LRAQIEGARADFETLRASLDGEREARVRAQTELSEATAGLAEQKRLLEEAKTRLTDTFKALSSDALKSNRQAFVERAAEVLKPLRESLKRYEEQVQGIEKSRQDAYVSLREQLKVLSATHQDLQRETGNLVTALRTPQVRGHWGELGLRRSVELAGMSEHCDFTEQVSVQAEDGRQRPDMIVHLPAGREIVVDSKVSLDAYMSALSAESEEKRQRLRKDHARQTRNHMEALARKAYWEQFDQAPEFVVMFIRSESFFRAAVDHDLTLIEDGLRNGVVMATPTTLIALLRAVAYGWRQEQLAKNAQAISDLGRQLYERLRVLAEHLTRIGGGLERAIGAYNDAVGSMERRVFPSARRFKELGVTAGADIPTVEPVEIAPRTLNPPEPPDQTE
jgi:DNA recombination protein RmuC